MLGFTLVSKENSLHRTARLVLGTAQLGMPYGIANEVGQPQFEDSRRIIQTAFEKGIAEFDTAQTYGNSEKVLGRIFVDLQINRNVRVISKLHPEIDFLNKEKIRASVETSISNMKVERLHGLMLHEEHLLDKLDGALGETLSGMVRDRMVQHIGASVYTPFRAKQALKSGLMNMVQIPTSIVDRRFINAGIFELADACRKTLYVRSAFLQGLILMNADSLPDHMKKAEWILHKLDEVAGNLHLSRKSIALLYLREKAKNARIVFGAETADQVRQNVTIWGKEELSTGAFHEIDRNFVDVEDEILNPASWQRGASC
jgi:aryl-alcohol dehydrogenase-like predicted oxidoreductase